MQRVAYQVQDMARRAARLDNEIQRTRYSARFTAALSAFWLAVGIVIGALI